MSKMSYREQTIVEEGGYDAEFLGTSTQDTKHGEAMRWRFKILNDPDFEGEEVTGLTAEHLSPGNSAGRFYQGLGGSLDGLVRDDVVDPDEYKGTKVRIEVVNNQQGDVTYSNVTSVRALRRRSTQRDTSTREPEEGEREPTQSPRRQQSSDGGGGDDLPF